MEFTNHSGIEAGWTWGLDKDGRELLIVAAKATYVLPENGQAAVLAEQQVKLVEADIFTGEPGLSAPLYETDYAHRKPKCDVILNGSAYAPRGVPTESARVSLRIGSFEKSFHVFGERHWQGGILSMFPTDPEPFTRAPITYNTAYGGADFNEDQPEKVATYPENPIGTGYHPIRRRSALQGRTLPNTSEDSRPITDTEGKYKPMAFGSIGRNFFPRYKYAGTYDQEWLDTRVPFWPDDFSYAYFQCAPEDQQIPHPQGGEEVVLENLTEDGVRVFQIPKHPVPVTFLPQRGEDLCHEAVCDTLVIEPDLARFSMTWRVALPLRRNLFELKQTIVGEMPRSWHVQRSAEARGKTYYKSLADYITARRGGRP